MGRASFVSRPATKKVATTTRSAPDGVDKPPRAPPSSPSSGTTTIVNTISPVAETTTKTQVSEQPLLASPPISEAQYSSPSPAVRMHGRPSRHTGAFDRTKPTPDTAISPRLLFASSYKPANSRSTPITASLSPSLKRTQIAATSKPSKNQLPLSINTPTSLTATTPETPHKPVTQADLHSYLRTIIPDSSASELSFDPSLAAEFGYRWVFNGYTFPERLNHRTGLLCPKQLHQFTEQELIALSKALREGTLRAEVIDDTGTSLVSPMLQPVATALQEEPRWKAMKQGIKKLLFDHLKEQTPELHVGWNEVSLTETTAATAGYRWVCKGGYELPKWKNYRTGKLYAKGITFFTMAEFEALEKAIKGGKLWAEAVRNNGGMSSERVVQESSEDLERDNCDQVVDTDYENETSDKDYDDDGTPDTEDGYQDDDYTEEEDTASAKEEGDPSVIRRQPSAPEARNPKRTQTSRLRKRVRQWDIPRIQTIRNLLFKELKKVLPKANINMISLSPLMTESMKYRWVCSSGYELPRRAGSGNFKTLSHLTIEQVEDLTEAVEKGWIRAEKLVEGGETERVDMEELLDEDAGDSDSDENEHKIPERTASRSSNTPIAFHTRSTDRKRRHPSTSILTIPSKAPTKRPRLTKPNKALPRKPQKLNQYQALQKPRANATKMFLLEHIQSRFPDLSTLTVKDIFLSPSPELGYAWKMEGYSVPRHRENNTRKPLVGFSMGDHAALVKAVEEGRVRAVRVWGVESHEHGQPEKRTVSVMNVGSNQRAVSVLSGSRTEQAIGGLDEGVDIIEDLLTVTDDRFRARLVFDNGLKPLVLSGKRVGRKVVFSFESGESQAKGKIMLEGIEIDGG
ncbi:hypothetical protein BJ508DRAFT_336074 [Ascobolus immersus RN42]|uniref:Uncharacterized protein n=1 Tax=Ascobolus immersus RN42 TaxID=1160509 RepID=A0A3N4HDU4_ASCIM|nr:hypothetical protein BJ508DRAFT_336074 [Ascobolus immersus RN42]